MIYLVKLINRKGEEFFAHTYPMENSKNITIKKLNTSEFLTKKNILEKEEWISAKIQVVKEIPDMSFVLLEMFYAMVEDIKKTERFRYVNGSFLVHSHLKEKDENYVYIIVQPDGIHRIGYSKNVIKNFYYLFYGKNAGAGSLAEYVRFHGTEDIKVFLRGPFSSDMVEIELANACHDFGFWSDFPDWEKKRSFLKGSQKIKVWSTRDRLPLDLIRRK